MQPKGPNPAAGAPLFPKSFHVFRIRYQIADASLHTPKTVLHQIIRRRRLFHGVGSIKRENTGRKGFDIRTKPDQVGFVKIVNVQEAKTHLSRLIDQAAAGEVIFLGKHGKPLAKLSAYAPRREPRPLGGLEDSIIIAADFDEEDPRVNALFLGTAP